VTKAFTPLFVANLKPQQHRTELPDPQCRGLYVIVQPSGVKSWAFRYRFAGRARKLTLGPLAVGPGKPNPQVGDALTLAAARKLAAEAHREVEQGRDPGVAKLERMRTARAQAEDAAEDTIEKMAAEYSRISSKRWSTISISGHKAGVAGIYNKAVYANEKAQALQRWADEVGNIAVGKSAKVVPLRPATETA
jgi:Arm DNA-binding domain